MTSKVREVYLMHGYGGSGPKWDEIVPYRKVPVPAEYRGRDNYGKLGVPVPVKVRYLSRWYRCVVDCVGNGGSTAYIRGKAIDGRIYVNLVGEL